MLDYYSFGQTTLI